MLAGIEHGGQQLDTIFAFRFRHLRGPVCDPPDQSPRAVNRKARDRCPEGLQLSGLSCGERGDEGKVLLTAFFCVSVESLSCTLENKITVLTSKKRVLPQITYSVVFRTVVCIDTKRIDFISLK